MPRRHVALVVCNWLAAIIAARIMRRNL